MYNSRTIFFGDIKKWKYAWGLTFFFFVYMTATSFVYANQMGTFEGTLQGASCVHYKLECPEDEEHIAMEHDFVLLLPDGKHYFLPNLSRITKARYATKGVRVQGEIAGHEIWVEALEVKKENEYSHVWSRKDQQALYRGGG